MNTVYDFAFSEQGYHHIKTGKVCQDSSGHYCDDLMAVVVVADGHGSDNYPRTDRGSRFAVEAAITAIREFVGTVESSGIDISEDSDTYLEQLAKNILAKWYGAVDADLQKEPLTEAELSKVADKYKKRYLSGQRREKAYGTTLIAACQTENYWFGLQIGDGRCVCISEDGTLYEPIAWDEHCQANITTSICDADAIDEFRYSFMKVCPVATLMGSDGIDDSYANCEELYVLYRSILAIFAQYGLETGEAEIKEFLPMFSRKGSGDDVSIAGIVSATLTPAFTEVLKAQCEYANAKAQREKAEREAVLAVEKEEYLRSALEKARMNFELCVQKNTQAQLEVEEAQRNREEAAHRLAAAEDALCSAMAAYQCGGMPVMEPGETEKKATLPSEDEREEPDAQQKYSAEEDRGEPLAEKYVEIDVEDAVKENAQPATETVQPADQDE